MFARVALRSGAIVPTLLRTSKPCVVAAPKLMFHTSQERLGYKLPELPDKVRMGFIPEEWFQMFYPKTGVTGPYVFGTGLVLFLLNKEIYILGPETMHGIAIFGIIIYSIKKFGPMIAAYMDAQRETQLKDAYEWKETQLKEFTDNVEEDFIFILCLYGRHHFFDAKRENVAMQLEIEFRERQLALSNAVKKRLDYHVDMENLQTRMQQQHMVRWIEKNVVQSITPKQEKELLDKCITDLKGMAVTA
ncbi:ATP synthase F(0) complex subunit B1, mitochondrial-like [Amphiura filiformis]|uniref:ATP synthase F(0) complex subunit B1, mitochondrial-like n=1 Tax=Amphiura filiformis TaxID=82378 RepID=UPI003B20BD75